MRMERFASGLRLVLVNWYLTAKNELSLLRKRKNASHLSHKYGPSACAALGDINHVKVTGVAALQHPGAETEPNEVC